MKIELYDLGELAELIRILHPEFLAANGYPTKTNPTALRDMADIHFGKLQTAPSKMTAEFPPGVTTYPTNTADQPDGLPQDIQAPVGPTDTVSTVQVANPVDASGRRWDERIDSSSKETTGKGLWRARRNVPDDVRAAVLAELTRSSKPAQPVTDAALCEDEGCDHHGTPHVCVSSQSNPLCENAEPLVTETHALPVEEPEVAPSEPPPPPPSKAIDHTALIAASQEAALDASDSHTDLLTACQSFIGAYGHAAYGELRKHVAPKDEHSGKAIQEFTPAERRLMQACIVNYPKHTGVPSV